MEQFLGKHIYEANAVRLSMIDVRSTKSSYHVKQIGTHLETASFQILRLSMADF